jgi:acetylornithine deacetylase
MNYAEKVNNWVEKNKDDIFTTLSELVQIKTVNKPPRADEKPGQEYLYNKVSKYIPKKDIDVFNIDDVPGIREHPMFFPTMDGMIKDFDDRPNLVAKLEGSGNGKSLVFTGHMDTMPVYGKKWKIFEDPFSGKVKDGKMYGRGIGDMKAGTLSGFFALKCLTELGLKLKGDIFAESVIDEENGGVNGTIAARLRNPDIDFAILSEPTDMVVGVETIGGTDWKVTVEEEGPGGIDASTELSNPIYKLSKIALALDKYDKKIGKTRPPANYSKDTRLKLLTYQLYSGGSNYLESGGVPTAGHIYFWLETFAGTNEEQYRKDFMDFIKNELDKYREFKENFPKFKTVLRHFDGHRTDKNHPAMHSIRKVVGDLNLQCKEGGLPLACDAFSFKKVSKTDVVVFGPVGKNYHGMDEYVVLDSVLKLIKIMVLTAIDFCG